jgi:hypothetical protein
MKTTSGIESHTSPVPGVIPEPSLVHDEPAALAPQSSGRSADTTTGRRQNPLARLGAALRGDKYMVDAYPPADASEKTHVEVKQ